MSNSLMRGTLSAVIPVVYMHKVKVGHVSLITFPMATKWYFYVTLNNFMADSLLVKWGRCSYFMGNISLRTCQM